MSNSKSILDFFKKSSTSSIPSSALYLSSSSMPEVTLDEQHKRQRVDNVVGNKFALNRDPAKRRPIWEYPANSQDEIRRYYLIEGPYRPRPEEFDFDTKTHHRRFNASWYDEYSWLEYSDTTHAAYCLPCYVFAKESGNPSKNTTFYFDGFRNWKKCSEKQSPFLTHVGNNPCSTHQNAVMSGISLLKPSTQIDARLNQQSTQEIAKNRLRLKVTIDAIRWLASQGCAFRGHDESLGSSNRGNFYELVELISKYDKDVAAVVLENASKNAKYTSPDIQKEILSIWAKRVRSMIRENVGNSKFCIIVDEARDESKREQMGLVIRFVDQEGFVTERFLDLVHVSNTTTLTLKEAISSVLSRHCLLIQDIRGQGYDGASNIRGEWNGLQALFLKECPFAYYVHCMAHRLQLALVAASREVPDVCQFFINLNLIINTVSGSCKRNDELQDAQADEYACLIANNELETGRGLNQIGTLQRAGDTRWGSHLKSICSLERMFGSSKKVLENLAEQTNSSEIRRDAYAAYRILTSFEFVFILHVMKKIMGFTDLLCQSLQKETQDMANAIKCVSITKEIMQNSRDDGWGSLIENVKSFCEKHKVKIPNMSKHYSKGIGRPRNQTNAITIEHHYRFDIFTAVVDSTMSELDRRFNYATLELFTLILCLDPKNCFVSSDKILSLVDKFYPKDFTDHERFGLENELTHFPKMLSIHDGLAGLTTISELCRAMVVTKTSTIYPMLHRLICLVLTLPVSTATTERAFSAMKIVKTRLRNKMEDDYLADSLIVYIEREISEKISTDTLIDDFYVVKNRRVQLS